MEKVPTVPTSQRLEDTYIVVTLEFDLLSTNTFLQSIESKHFPKDPESSQSQAPMAELDVSCRDRIVPLPLSFVSSPGLHIIFILPSAHSIVFPQSKSDAQNPPIRYLFFVINWWSTLALMGRMDGASVHSCLPLLLFSSPSLAHTYTYSFYISAQPLRQQAYVLSSPFPSFFSTATTLIPFFAFS